MKMTKKDYAELKQAIDKIAQKHGGWGVLCEHYRMRGLSWMRFRWDIFHRLPGQQVKHLYTYLHDDHVDTALRRIVPSPEEATE